MGYVAWWVLSAGIACLSALLCWRGYFMSTALIFLGWLGIAIWAWRSSTDTRHLDYALAADGGDAGMIFAINTLLIGLPAYFLGASAGCLLYFRRRVGPSSLPGSGDMGK
ncbi:MAG: hypothetical protein WAS26_09145 [Paracoccaceae bacterium]